jgi:recombination protein RecR
MTSFTTRSWTGEQRLAESLWDAAGEVRTEPLELLAGAAPSGFEEDFVVDLLDLIDDMTAEGASRQAIARAILIQVWPTSEDSVRPSQHSESSNPHFTESLRHLMELLGKLPGVGARSAERFAFFLLRSSHADALALANAIRAVKEQVRYCSICFNLTEGDPCSICDDATRDHSIICVVEQPEDLAQLESTGIYKGVYHVLLGQLVPLENVGPGDLTIPQLLKRLKPGSPVKEIVLAINPTMEGDNTALHLQKEIAACAPQVTVTQLSRSLPAGMRFEYSNKSVLSDALSGRAKV